MHRDAVGRLGAGLLVISLMAVPASANAMDFSKAVQEAQASNPNLQAANYAYQAGLEKGKQGTALYLPQITATGTYNRVHTNTYAELPAGFAQPFLSGDTSGHIEGYSVTLVQPIYNAEVFSGAAQLKDQARLASIQYSSTSQNLILQVAQVYFGVLMAQDNLRLTREQKAAVSQQLASAEERFKVGKTNITDVDEARARYDAIVAQEINAQNNLAVQQAQFVSIVGNPPQNLAKVPETFKPHPLQPDDLQVWIDKGLKGNPAVQSAQIQVDISQAEIDQYKLISRPQLNMFASYSDMRGSGFLPIFAQPRYSKQTKVGMQLSVPLFTGGSNNSKLREALAQNKQAQYQLQATISNTTVQIKQQYLNIQVGVPQITALQQAVVAAKSSLDANILGEKVGVRTTTDVLNAQQQYYSTLQNLDAARYQYLLSTLNIKALVGTLDEKDVQGVNAYLVAAED